jgi:quercetin dioxygenase-like cupin family protein
VQQWDLRSLDVQAHHPEVLQSDGEGRGIVLALPQGERLQEHRVHERTWLMVVEGEIEIDHEGEVVAGGPGTLAVFAPNEAREVRARSDARLLMVLAPWPGVGHPSQHVG